MQTSSGLKEVAALGMMVKENRGSPLPNALFEKLPVSLMRYETLSYNLFLKLQSGHPTARYDASRSGLLLLVLALVLICIEMAMLRKLRLDRVGTGTGRPKINHLSVNYKVAGLVFFGLVFLLSVVVPTSTVIYWTTWNQNLPAADAGFYFGEQPPGLLAGLGPALWDSVRFCLPAAIVCAMLAIPIALLRARFPSRGSFVLERLPYLGYATPPLVFAGIVDVTKDLKILHFLGVKKCQN